MILAQSKDVGDSAPLVLIELLVVLVFLFLAFGSREFAYAPALPALIEDANLEEGALKEHYLGNLREAYLLNLNALSVKFFYFRWAGWVILVFGLTVTAVGIAGALR